MRYISQNQPSFKSPRFQKMYELEIKARQGLDVDRYRLHGV